MLADPRYSQLALINLGREGGGVSAEFTERRRESLSLLAAAIEIFGVGMYVVVVFVLVGFFVVLVWLLLCLDGDGLSLWRNERFTASLAASNASFIFLGGAFLEEDVFIAALEGVRAGYDVRLLADLSIARCEADRSLVLDRLALHGVLCTTIRQALLEWTVCFEDPIIRQKVRELLR